MLMSEWTGQDHWGTLTEQDWMHLLGLPWDDRCWGKDYPEWGSPREITGRYLLEFVLKLRGRYEHQIQTRSALSVGGADHIALNKFLETHTDGHFDFDHDMLWVRV